MTQHTIQIRLCLTAACPALVLFLVFACGGCKRSPTGPTPPTPKTSVPTITSISPTSGPTSGGTAVTITGTNFAAGATVTICGVPATNVQVPSSTQITAMTGAGAAGTGDVSVTVNGQTGRLPGGFTYLAAVSVSLSFVVYNHTAGPKGTFTQTVEGFSNVTLRIADLGVSAGVTGTQAAINVLGVDPDRIVVRHQAQGGRIGDFVAFSNTGSVVFQAPNTDAAYDVFLMNSTPPCITADGPRSGTFYHEIDSRWTDPSSRVFKRAATVYRAPDEGGVNGPDEPIETAWKVFNSGLNYPWMRYGSLKRITDGGDYKLVYGWWSWCQGHYSGWGAASPFGIACCLPNPGGLEYLWYGWQQNMFQIFLGFVHIDPYSGYTCSGFVLQPGGGWSEIGRDLVAYIYVRDPVGW